MSSVFTGCSSLKTVTWTPGAQNTLSSMNNTFSGCILLSQINLPTSMTSLNNIGSLFQNCRTLTSVTFPATLNSVTTMASTFSGCINLTSITLPTSMSACNTINAAFFGCVKLRSITLPNILAQNTIFTEAFRNCVALTTITFPGASQLALITNISFMFNGCSNLVTINNFDKIGSLTATPLIDGSSLLNNQLISISFRGPYSVLGLNGFTSTSKANVQSVRLLNTSAGQWTGASPQINVSNTNMSTANLVQLFNDMAAQPAVTGKTINITTATGAAGLTPANRLIITSKGWTIIG
jgi:hypothetical protein